MKRKVKKLITKQDGHIFLIALVLLAIGGLMLPPVLSFMGTGIKVSELHEEKMFSLYAADAGIEDALYVLQYQSPDTGEFPYSGNISNINGNYVEYSIELEIVGEETQSYKITSTATDLLDGSVTTVEVFIKVTEIYSAYGVLALDGDIKFGGGVEIGDESGRPTNIHANGNINSASTTTVSGNATAAGTITNITVTGDYTITENVDHQVTVDIDTSHSSAFYLDAWGGDYYGDLSINGYAELGPAFIDGDLEVQPGQTLNLTGNVWVTGSVDVKGIVDSVADVTDNTSIEDMYAIISENTLSFSAQSEIGSEGHYVLLISLAASNPAIDVGGDGDAWAILYAPYGHIDSAGGTSIMGAAVGKSVRIQGNSPLNYPFPAKHGDSNREIDILSYIIK